MLYQTLNVPLTPAYPVYIGSELLTSASYWHPHLPDTPLVIVTSAKVAQLHAARLVTSLDRANCTVLEIPDGETYKTVETWHSLLADLAQRGLPRDATLITVGGGTVGDLGGFAAACYQRGIRWLQCPTTLLAQVDAAIGGKVGVNLPAGKNLVGTFYQPAAVFIDIDTLRTLPDREYRAGLAEVVKAALIQDAAFFIWLEQHADAVLHRDPDALLPMISRACEIKQLIVAQDEREQHHRMLLNLGHTFGHALEQVTGYREFLHGEAVAIGLVLAARLSTQLGLLSLQDACRVTTLLAQLQLPTQLPHHVDAPALLTSMRLDKKIRQSRLRLILLHQLGRAFVTDQVTEAALLHCLASQ